MVFCLGLLYIFITGTTISHLMSFVHSWKSDILCKNADQEPISRYFKLEKL